MPDQEANNAEAPEPIVLETTPDGAAVGDEAADDRPLPKTQAEFFERAREKVRSKFPKTPGVYLFQDEKGRVLYVGKAKNLRARAGSYFLKAAAEDPRTMGLVKAAYEIDYLDAESEVDALLMESRLIKDILPRFNRDLRDNKSFPYLQITTHEDFPRVEITREPKSSSAKLYGPFTSVGALRGALQALQKAFKFRTCSLDIEDGDERWRWFRPCLLASIDQCTAPCNLRVSKEDYRKDIARLRTFLEGGRKKLLKEMREEMALASKELKFEKAAKLRDEINALERLKERGDLEEHEQPEVFYVDPKKGVTGLQKVLGLAEPPRVIEGVDIAHLGGGETVASLVRFIDGMPFKPGYRRFRIREVDGVDDYASIREVVSRRYGGLKEMDEIFPDLLLIDGGKGQLAKGMEAFEQLGVAPPTTVISLAKKEELVYRPGESEPLRLSRHAFALRLLQYVRDESHRFAQHYHHLLRSKRTLGE
ncbi:UvrABC system protein C [Pseudobythopirellula maris]|uniref:UvrABC system protein C n=1 Tax=Pseudobythopirellula maris TaxID=2527991 RepID=A0A5C5ZN74_9BACT|nr:excinuclease ABC subunit UvrC [Pseudobythopirellula maris]TWT88608.1 UvrABC system protein C [Pseudobythopirellula maris]